jgi:hypothetical protein
MTYMTEKKTKKGGRNLYIPDFISQMLDIEAETYEGPGTVAAASIYAFCMMDESGKRKALKSYKEKEIDVAYGGDSIAKAMIEELKAVHSTHEPAERKVARAKAGKSA